MISQFYAVLLIFVINQSMLVTEINSEEIDNPNNDNEIIEELGRHDNKKSDKDDLLVLTVATEETDGFKRYIRSAREFGIKVDVLGLDEEWKGGNMLGPGGAQKIRLLRHRLEALKDRSELLVMFTDAFDVIINAPKADIIKMYQEKFPLARAVFGAEGYCWPDDNLRPQYPLVRVGKRYLNSGVFMGYADTLYQIVSHHAIEDTDDDQLYYTKLYIDDKIRTELKIELDHTADLFQNLNGADYDVEMVYRDKEHAEIHNHIYNTYPLVIHGNGPSKLQLNQYANYIGNYFNEIAGCVACRENRFPLTDVKTRDLPIIGFSIIVPAATPFLEEFFELVSKLDYPRHRMFLFVYNPIELHAKVVTDFVKKMDGEFAGSLVVLPGHDMTERQARSRAVSTQNQQKEFCLEKSCHYMFMLDSDVSLTNPQTLKLLIEQHRPVIAPILRKPGKLWSNFWGSVTEQGYYARSLDYEPIVVNDKVGLWNVPFMSKAYLINKGKLAAFKKSYFYNQEVDPDMSFCEFARNEGHFMYVDNQHHYGHLITTDEYDTTKKHPEIFQLFDNLEEWKARFLHPNYSKALDPDTVLDQPCPDVYDFPFFTERFAKEFIEELEHFGQWSSGSNYDERLQGGYENVPTRDIHMKQIDFERHWLYLLDTYVRPIQEKVYTGYYHQPIESYMMFVVRYKPDEQNHLRPHHDASTYSVDIAFNEMDKDFQQLPITFLRKTT